MNEQINLKGNLNLKQPLQGEKNDSSSLSGHVYMSQKSREYHLPIATNEILGGVKAEDAATVEDKAPVYVDKNGKLWVTAVEDKFFIFDQPTLSLIWNIEHNLGKYPSVTVKDSGGSTCVGEVEYLGLNKLAVHFSLPVSGRAYLN